MSNPQLPPGYQVSRDVTFSSRWIVSYRGDPFFFVEKVNALGEERIKTFKTKRAATQAVLDHAKRVAELEAQAQVAQAT